MFSTPARHRPGRRLAATAAVLLAAAGTLACSSSDSEGTTTTTTKEAAASTTTAPEDGGTVVTKSGPIELAVGERATIELEANPTTGFQWEFTADPNADVVKVVSDEYRSGSNESGMVGSGGTQTIVIEGVAAGTSTVELQYVRPWETDHSGAETATFDVTVS